MKVLKLIYYGDPVLRKKAAPVKKINEKIKQLVQNMIETMKANHGMGLAAPQVGESLRIFIACFPIENDEGKQELTPPKVYINPKLIDPSKETCEETEGCLSIPHLHGNVRRPTSITIEATDIEGNNFKETLTGLSARVVMHENDHLNGTLWVDRITKEDRKDLEPELQKIKKKYSSTKTNS